MFSILSLIFGINNSNNVYVQNNDFNVNTGFTKYVKKEAEKCLNYSIEKNIDFLHIGQWLDSYHHKDFMNYDGENYLAKLNIKVEGDFKLKLTDIYE